MSDSAWQRRYVRLSQGLFGLAALLTVLAVLVAAYLAEWHRGRFIQGAFLTAMALTEAEDPMMYRRWARCAALLAVVSWPLVASLWLLVWWKHDREAVKRHQPLLLTGSVPLLGLLVLAGAVVVHYGGWVSFFRRADDHDLVDVAAAHYAGALATFGLPYPIWTATELAVIVTALVAAIASNVLPKAPCFARSQLVLAAATLTLGLVAYGATRAHAADAALPLPLWRPELQLPVSEVPTIDACDPSAASLERGVVITVDAGGEVLDAGRKVEDLAALRKLLRDRFVLEQTLNPHRAACRVILAAPPSARLEALAPVIATAREAGAREISAARTLPERTWSSHTHGPLRFRKRTCAIPFDPAALPQAGTWGEWAAGSY